MSDAIPVDDLKRILAAQYEAVLFMLHECLDKCPPPQWDEIIGKYAFWHTAYHTLYCTDSYLSKDEESFKPNQFHPQGMAELENEYPSRRFERDELLRYVDYTRNRAKESVARETLESLAGASGFPWYKVTRLEMHLINIRHVQHHAGQLSALIRKSNPSMQDPKAVRWSGSGWKTN